MYAHPWQGVGEGVDDDGGHDWVPRHAALVHQLDQIPTGNRTRRVAQMMSSKRQAARRMKLTVVCWRPRRRYTRSRSRRW